MSRSCSLLVLDTLSPRNSMNSSPVSRRPVSDMFQCYRPLLLSADCLKMRKFMGWLTITLSFLKFIPMRSFISTLRILCHFCAQYQSADAKPARWHQSLVHLSLCYMMYKSTMSRSLAQTCSWWTLPNGVRRRERLQMFATGRAKTLQTHREKNTWSKLTVVLISLLLCTHERF